jgi:hypothetical protein
LLPNGLESGDSRHHFKAMIVFKLSCGQGHTFEGWFASADDVERQRETGQLACPECEDADITKLPSAPYINVGPRGDKPVPPVAQPGMRELALRKLKEFVVANTEEVGRAFPEIARRIHYGEEGKRGIRGTVTLEEAQALEEEGVSAFPLPPELALGAKVH